MTIMMAIHHTAVLL